MLEMLCFDADDTLWHNERFFRLTQERFAELLADHAGEADLGARLLEAERRNLGRYGFGIKGFTLSMIETALDVTGDRVPGEVIRDLIAAGQEMLGHPIELLPGVAETLRALAAEYPLMLITKGDLMDQERKLAQSGLGDLFKAVEVVSDKTAPVYRALFARHGITPERAVMSGNSLKSDVLPVLDIGGWGVFVPHDLTWEVEHAEEPESHRRYHRVDGISGVPDVIGEIIRNM